MSLPPQPTPPGTYRPLVGPNDALVKNMLEIVNDLKWKIAQLESDIKKIQ